jgi:hypothetical protein
VEDCERCKWWNDQGLSSRCPPHDAEWADRFFADLASKQEPLSAEFAEVLAEGIADGSLYVKST